MANKAALVLLLVISLAGKTVHRVFVCEKKQRLYSAAHLYTTAFMALYTGCVRLAESVTLCPSVCLSRVFFLTLIEHSARRILNATHQRAARDAASAHFSPVWRGRTFLYCNIAVWYSLDINTRAAETFLTSRRKFKTELLVKSNDTWTRGRPSLRPVIHVRRTFWARYKFFYYICAVCSDSAREGSVWWRNNPSSCCYYYYGGCTAVGSRGWWRWWRWQWRRWRARRQQWRSSSLLSWPSWMEIGDL